MCCCGKPTINGEPGAYSWDGKSFNTRQPAPPDLAEGDKLVYDEPGRCGGVDSHAFHFRLVKEDLGSYCLLVRHGAGDERIRLGGRPGIKAFDSLDSDGRYWLLQMLYHVQQSSASNAREATDNKWRQAAADKRIKTRKNRGRGTVKVWIEENNSPADLTTV